MKIAILSRNPSLYSTRRLVEAAEKSPLNRTDPFEGYEKVLRPHLDLELLKRGNKPIEHKAKI